MKLARAKRMLDPAKREHARKVARDISERNREARRLQNKLSKERHKKEIEAKRRAQYYADHHKSLAKNAEKRARNIEVIRERDKEHKRRLWREKTEEMRAYGREFYAKNSLRVRIRNRVSKALRQQRVDKVMTAAGYGIDVPAIAAHLGPCPGNPAEWHIDHVRPLASFDLTDPAQFAAAFAPTNHQWLTADENRKKGAKHG
jgi:hypothetical protein